MVDTKNKNIISTVGIGIAAWHVLTMGGNPLNLPALPGIISNPLFGGFSLLTMAGGVAAWSAFRLWLEY